MIQVARELILERFPMHDHDLAIATFARLARISADKSQPAGCDRFLALAAKEACYAGVLDIAERCRELVGLHNAHHVLMKSSSCTDAVRHADNVAFFQSLDRFCSFERAEHLLSTHNESITGDGYTTIAKEELARVNRG